MKFNYDGSLEVIIRKSFSGSDGANAKVRIQSGTGRDNFLPIQF